jgi:hypothetical protein
LAAAGFGAGREADAGARFAFFAIGRLAAERATTRAAGLRDGRFARRTLVALARRVGRGRRAAFDRAFGRAAVRRGLDRVARAGFDRERRVERRAAFLAAMDLSLQPG